MKLNRKWLLIVSLVLSVAMATTGTLAYLTDSDMDVNIMTVGEVKIVQNEQQRDIKADGTYDNSKLEAFENNKMALPAVYGASIAATDEITIDEQEYKLYSQETVKNVLDKIVTVTNQGNTDAYIRTLIAFEMVKDESSSTYKNVANALYNEVSGKTSVSKVGESTFTYAGGTEKRYEVWCFTYTDKLAKYSTSVPSLLQFYIDKTATSADMASLGKELEIIVLTQAVQVDGFATAADAFKFALDNDQGTIDPNNLKGWFETGKIGSPGDKSTDNAPAQISAENATELRDALTNIKPNTVISLAENTDYSADNNDRFVIDGTLDNVTIKGAEGIDILFTITENAVLKNVTFTDMHVDEVNAKNTGAFMTTSFLSIADGASVENLVIKDSSFKTTTSGVTAFGVAETTTEITFENTVFDGFKYALYRAGEPIDYIAFKNCTFKNIDSWVMMFNGGDVGKGTQFSFDGCVFEHCVGGIAKFGGGQVSDSKFTFTNNKVSNSMGHDSNNAKWFEIKFDSSKITAFGNTLDGAVWTPNYTQGLGLNN